MENNDVQDFVINFSAFSDVKRGYCLATGWEAIAQEAGADPLDKAMTQASVSKRRGAAFGMAIVGVTIVPVLMAAARQFRGFFSKEIRREARRERRGGDRRTTETMVRARRPKKGRR